jgi:hypothetical protein
MGRQSRGEYLKAIYGRYQQASRHERGAILNEFCATCGYHRKYAIRLLRGPVPAKSPPRRRPRSRTYGDTVLSVLTALWEAAGYPWSLRLKALLPLWLPWAQKRFRFSDTIAEQLLKISPRTIDYRLREKKRSLQRRLYGHTKPGALLKHQIPIKTDSWDVTVPGFTEIDLVSHSGQRADGEFAYSLNLTDLYTTWVETRAVLGKAETHVSQALEGMRQALPFALCGIDSDNGSEFINAHLWSYSQDHHIEFTRGRPYKKNDNAHIEPAAAGTHVRKLIGYERYDSPQAVAALNALYTQELRLFENLFLPSLKLQRKVRVGSRTRRFYSQPQTPLDRLRQCPQADPAKAAALERQREALDPFELSRTIERKLERIYTLAHRTRTASPKTISTESTVVHRHSQKEKRSKKEREDRHHQHHSTPVTSYVARSA